MLIIWGVANGEVVCEYTGNAYTQVMFDDSPPEGSFDLSMNVQGQFVFAEELPDSEGKPLNLEPLRWSFNNGRANLDETNSTAKVGVIVAGGEIVNWSFSVAAMQASNVTEGLSVTISSRYLATGAPKGLDTGQVAFCVEGSQLHAFCPETRIDQAITVDQPGNWSCLDSSL